MAKLEGNRWIVENITGTQDTVIEPEAKHSIYISKVVDGVVTVSGKCNTIMIDDCSGSGIIFSDVIATVEVVNSKKMQLQANAAVPQIMFDKCEGGTVYLQTAAAQSAEIVTSLSRELNVVIPGATEEDDAIEFPVPAQFVSCLKDGEFATIPAEHV